MTTAMFKRTGGDDFPNKIKGMLTGPPKSGKTSFLGTVPNIVIADTEPHANNLQSVAHLDLPYITVNGMDDLHQLRFVLGDETLRAQAAASLGMDKIEAVAIDTLDTLQKIMKSERMREQRATKFLRDDWAWLKTEMEALVESFTALPLHVFFIVHTKTKDVGTEDNSRTIILPGLEGSIAESIAGMVGYSLLSFRKEEIRQDGSKFTKYWLRAEGDETYEFLGNRAAGRLPDVIEPDFKSLYAAAMAGRPTAQAAPTQMPNIQTTGQTPPAAAAQPVGQTSVQPAAPAAAPSPVPSSPAAAKPADDAPITAAAVGHVKKVYDALEIAFPEDTIRGLTIGDARNIVRIWQFAQKDAAEGKAEPGSTPQSVTLDYLTAQGWVSTEAKAAPEVVEPKLDGTIEQVKAYVGDGSDLNRVVEAYNIERNGKARKSLLDWLESKGATPVQTDVQTPEAPAAPEPTPEPEQPATPEPTPEPEAAVTPEPAVADASPTEEQAVATAAEALGASVVGVEINADGKCEECSGPLDDLDLAELGKNRFGRILCVADYIAETKKPKTATA